MSHSVARRRESHEQLYRSIAHNEPLCLDRHRQREDEDALLGIEHAEGEKYAVDGARGANRCPHVEERGVSVSHEHRLAYREVVKLLARQQVELRVLCQLLEQTRTHTAHDIVEKILLRSPCALNDTAEHPQRKHVEEDMAEASVRKHVREELVDVEVGCEEEVQTQNIVQVYAKTSEQIRGDEHRNVYYQKVFRYSRNIIHITLIYL